MNVKSTLAGVAAPLIFASASNAAITGLRAAFVDPNVATGAMGTWAANGYPTATLDTWRFYAVSNVADEILAAGDLFNGGNIMTITSSINAFHNGGIGNNGIQRPTDLTAVGFYEAQWDSFITIADLSTVSLSPGLTTALGADPSGMGGLTGNALVDNTGWYKTPNFVNNTTFNPTFGDHECLIMQLSVAEGVSIELTNVVITYSEGFSAKLQVSTVPAPGALALLGLAGLAARRRRR